MKQPLVHWTFRECSVNCLQHWLLSGDGGCKTCSQWKLLNISLLWRHNGGECVSNHQPHDCILNRLFRRRSKKTSKLRVTGLCAGNSPGTGEFPAQMDSNAENVSIWWRHQVCSRNRKKQFSAKVPPIISVYKCVFWHITHRIDYITHWGRDKMAAILQTTFSNAFSWMKMLEFRLIFHWSFFLRVQLTIFQHWFRYWLGAVQATSHYLNQCWLVYWRICASLGLNELILNKHVFL